MDLENVETICIETDFTRRYGLGSGNCRLEKINGVGEIYSGKRRGRFLVVLDVFSDKINYLKNIVKHRGSNKIIFILKPGVSRRYFRKYLRNPIDKITGIDYSMGFYLDSSFDYSLEPERSYVKLRFDDYLKIITIRLPRTLGLITLKTLRLLKFLIVGITGYVVNVTSAYMLMNFFLRVLGRAKASLLVALLAIEFSIDWNYMLHEKWTFRDVPRLKSVKAYAKRLVEYHVVSLGSIIMQTLCVYLLTGIMGKPLILSITLGVVLGFFLNYILSRKLVWGGSFEYR